MGEVIWALRNVYGVSVLKNIVVTIISVLRKQVTVVLWVFRNVLEEVA